MTNQSKKGRPPKPPGTTRNLIFQKRVTRAEHDHLAAELQRLRQQDETK